MEAGPLRRTQPPAAVIEAAPVALLFGLAAAGWAVTGNRMAGMDAGPGTELGSVGWFLGVWVTMMAAMMLPSLAPAALGFARTEGPWRGRSALARIGATAAFVVGYLVAWSAAGLLSYAIVEGARSLGLGLLGWQTLGPYVAGAVIAGAALYQLTPAKDACLQRCRTPVAVAPGHSRGHPEALRIGIEHGWFCIGCCWALMAALFALGVMSVAWMAMVAGLIAAEKLLPWKAVASRGVAIVLVVLGLAVALAPQHLPGLTIPHSPQAMQAMPGR
jgi:predicted metal-binding membrane protein